MALSEKLERLRRIAAVLDYYDSCNFEKLMTKISESSSKALSGATSYDAHEAFLDETMKQLEEMVREKMSELTARHNQEIAALKKLLA